MDTYCLFNYGAARDVCSQKLACLLDLANNPSWYNADVIMAHEKAILMHAYDVTVDVKGINESKMHTLHSVALSCYPQ